VSTCTYWLVFSSIRGCGKIDPSDVVQETLLKALLSLRVPFIDGARRRVPVWKNALCHIPSALAA